MVIDPRTESIELDEGRLVYQVLEGGTAGYVVWFQELNQHLDLCWTDPTIAETVGELARDQLTSVFFQARGLGLSDPVARRPTVEEQAADIIAVMDAEGIAQATLVGTFSTAVPVALIAAQQPGRVNGIVLLSPSMTGPLASQHEFGWTPERAHACVESYRRAGAGWGSGLSLGLWDRALDTRYNRRLVGMAERCSASIRVAADHVEFLLAQDGREIFPQIRVPARVIRVSGHVYPAATARAVADAIDGAEYHELPRSERGDSIGAAWRPITRHIAELVRGTAALTGTPERVMTSVLFTDIVGSTDHLARVGDAAWTALLTAHERLVRREVERTGGRLVRTIGDGTLCEFGGPAAAVRCAEALCAAAPDLGIEIRAGVHTGECERRGDDLAGIAVHIGARVSALAAASEVLVSRTVCDLVAGSGLAFASRGTHELKGVPGRWEVFAAGTQPQPPSALAPATPTPVDRAVVALARHSPRTLRVANRLGNAIQRRRAPRRASPARRPAP